ncbi:unnamed protein product [Penicillium salamii]|uniref:F-box domain-containing protein n=1 Tax=Penicillium salamii TaxID=1612424 RepID=A0A9W4JME6_9EURO|nr:unnamed protein product [Penicillium salamii]CAG8245469.1 unnamed protein product [Penicillium salamii]CAG8320618.1 unnamed protein product [Penicillium salamii]CAG8320915.1 unnamed protein product [Penicillium salamii]CAG8399526.1 unnamed protein product [Penicillium salamii]
MSNPAVTLDFLPNEVYIEILSDFSTRDLLPLISVNRRFHALVLRILHYRLLLTTPLKEYKLLLECFHPSSKLTEPHVFCKYLGTDGLSERHAENPLEEGPDAAQQLGRVTALYSRFRPQARSEEEEQSIAMRFGLFPGRMFLSGVGFVRADINGDKDKREDKVVREVTIDGYEDFSQLCVVASLVQVRPGTSLLLSASTIEDGFVRLWRDWLYRQSRKLKRASDVAKEEGLDEVQIASDPDDILWVDLAQTIGLKLRVRPKSWNPSFPVLMHQDDRDDDAWVGYEVILEELHIRATRLLLAVERSKEEQQYHHNNAIVIGAPPPA